ncbi:hypothetical protein CF204P1_08630 [Citrobacter freundii]|nr:hypothetical protein CF204P1_08630 [Citrobacter freundii]
MLKRIAKRCSVLSYALMIFLPECVFNYKQNDVSLFSHLIIKSVSAITLARMNSEMDLNKMIE